MNRVSGADVQRALKRAIDVMCSASLLILLLPLLTVTALAVRRSSPGPAIFRQQRAGRRGRPFTIYKFRTMTVPTDRLDRRESHEERSARITRVGRVLRRTSIDELPQLVNVLRGDMSLVGPRPDLLHHVARYTEAQRGRLGVRPGITGWAQVMGRNALTWEERIELDLAYIEGWTLRRDMEIAVRTIDVVLRGTGTGLRS